VAAEVDSAFSYKYYTIYSILESITKSCVIVRKIAEIVYHWTLNQRVLGSSPSASTKFFRHLAKIAPILRQSRPDFRRTNANAIGSGSGPLPTPSPQSPLPPIKTLPIGNPLGWHTPFVGRWDRNSFLHTILHIELQFFKTGRTVTES
jgi:hypothetical protein